jgi:hypothetical protein
MTEAPAHEPAAPLPELRSATLDLAEVERLLNDIELCTELTEIIPKHGPQDHVPADARLTLADARAMLRARTVRGLQLRYRHADADWWDTLMLTGDTFRLVRIRHEFPAT